MYLARFDLLFADGEPEAVSERVVFYFHLGHFLILVLGHGHELGLRLGDADRHGAPQLRDGQGHLVPPHGLQHDLQTEGQG